MGRRLKTHKLEVSNGLASNFNPLTVAGKFMSTAQNVDGYSRFRALSTLAGSTNKSPDLGDPVTSLHHFEFVDYDYIQKQKQLALVNATAPTLNERVDDSSWPAVFTSGADDAEGSLSGSPLCEARYFNRLFLSGEDESELATGGLKYDGTRVTNWGCVAPGSALTIIDPIDDATDWTFTNGSGADSPDVTRDLVGGVAVLKDAVTTSVVMEQTGISPSLDFSGAATGFVWLFLPSGVIQQLDETVASAVTVRLGQTATAYWEWGFKVGDLLVGWNRLELDYFNPTTEGGGGPPNLSLIDDVFFTLFTDNASFTWADNPPVWDELSKDDNGRLTALVGGAGSLTGTYQYRLSYLTDSGLESNASPASSSVSPSSQDVSLSQIPTSPDAQVIARRIYRAEDPNLDTYEFLVQIDDNATTSYTDDGTDSPVTGEAPPLSGDDEVDHTPPGRMADCAEHQNRIIGISGENKSTLFISNVNGPEEFPVVNQLNAPVELRAIHSHATGLLLYGSDRLYELEGDGTAENPYAIVLRNTQLGANGFRSVTRAKGSNIVLREREAFIVADPADPWYINGSVQDLFDEREFQAPNFPSFVLHDRGRFRYLFFVSSGLGAYTEPFVWQYGSRGIQQITGEGSGTDPQDFRIGTWSQLLMPNGNNPSCGVVVETDDDLPRIWVGTQNGRVVELQTEDTTGWELHTGAVDDVEAILEWHPVPIGADSGGRGVPRYLNLQFSNVPSEQDWDITIDLLTDFEGTLINSQTFTFTVPANETSVIVPIPNAGRKGEWCRVKLVHTAATPDNIIQEVELAYIPHTSWRGVRSS